MAKTRNKPRGRYAWIKAAEAREAKRRNRIKAVLIAFLVVIALIFIGAAVV